MSLLVLAGCLMVPGTALRAAGPVKATFLYTLANFGGQLRYNQVRVHVDADRNETYVLYQNVVRVFGPSGMEVFSFGDDLDLGQVLDAAVDRNGDVLLLTHTDGKTSVTRCNFRGVPVGPLEIRDLPEGVPFTPNRMFLQGGRFYFVSTNASTVIVTDEGGAFRDHIDLTPLLVDIDEKLKDGAEILGFAVDADGNMFFSVPVLFKVFKLSPDRKLSYFGRAGSSAGRFGIVGGVAIDSRGNILVADKLRCVILVFDSDFNFLIEFGYRGARPENLVVPDDIAIDQRDRLYVSQGRRRGISVFALTGE